MDADAGLSSFPFRVCDSYRAGHTAHFIQSRLSREDGPGTPRTIASVDDDGTINFTSGAPAWHHDPGRLRATLALYGTDVQFGTHSLLRLLTPTGSAYCFSVSPTPDPCHPEASQPVPHDSTTGEFPGLDPESDKSAVPAEGNGAPGRSTREIRKPST